MVKSGYRSGLLLQGFKGVMVEEQVSIAPRKAGIARKRPALPVQVIRYS